MNRRLSTILAVVLLLAAMPALMVGPVREESGTVDEPVYLAAGYTHWHGAHPRLNAEQPPLAPLLSALPLLFTDVKLSVPLCDLRALRIVLPETRPWSGQARPIAELFPDGPQNWYFWSFWETEAFSQMLLYDSDNDADSLLWPGRLVQVALTVLTGLVIFFWLRQLAGVEAGLLGTALWVFNPLALAYGHLILTDMGVTLFITLAVWAFIRYLLNPTARNALLTGLATGGALAMKFTAAFLVPIFAVLAVLHWLTANVESRRIGRTVVWLPVFAAATWVVILIVYAPTWKAAPPLPAEQAAKLGVPGWFQVLRPVLIPPDFFKGVALQAAHAAEGQESYLCGVWRQRGWWYYFPAALAMKLPVPLLLATLTGLGLALAGLRRFQFAATAPWVAAMTFLGLAMTGSLNIGVRYVLPIIPLLAVGAAAQFTGRSRPLRWIGWGLAAWLAAVAVWAHPSYLEYCNEIAGGTAGGYRVLLDSNYDWGQDVKRLKTYVDERTIGPFYLQFFGVQDAIEYYRLPAQRISSDQARQLRDGRLVISTQALMKPEWNWLRTSYRPVDRIGYTLFVFDLHQ